MSNKKRPPRFGLWCIDSKYGLKRIPKWVFVLLKTVYWFKNPSSKRGPNNPMGFCFTKNCILDPNSHLNYDLKRALFRHCIYLSICSTINLESIILFFFKKKSLGIQLINILIRPFCLIKNVFWSLILAKLRFRACYVSVLYFLV